MSKRKGNVQVLDYMVILSWLRLFFAVGLTSTQQRGWEPDAVLNWLALAGWGTHTEAPTQDDRASKTIKKAPDSTTVMSLSEIINNVRLFLLTRPQTSN